MNLTVQFYTMLSMTAMGIYIGAAIDTYGFFSKQRHSFHWLVACYDLLFWLIQAFAVFYVLLHFNHGEIRLYIFLALICGYAAYQALFSHIYQTSLDWITRLITKIYRFILSILFYLIIKPIKLILKLVYTLCMMAVTVCLAIILFVLRMIWTPLYWLIAPLLRWTGLTKQINKTKLISLKIKEFIQSIWKRKE